MRRTQKERGQSPRRGLSPSVLAPRQLACGRQLVDDPRDVLGEHLGELVTIDAAAASEFFKLPLTENILDLPPLDRLVGARANP